MVPPTRGHRVDPRQVARRLAPAVRWRGALDTEHRSWRLMARTPEFDAWLIAWPSGGRVELHDHGTSAGAISVISGTLVETVPRRDGAGRVPLVHHEPEAWATLGFGAGRVHDVTNESGGHALSLHVYSPALTTMAFYEMVGDELVPCGPAWSHDGSGEFEHGAPAAEAATRSALAGGR